MVQWKKSESASQECLSIFQKAVLWMQQLASGKAFEGRKPVILPLAWGSDKLPFRRSIAVEKAKLARLYGRASLGHGAQKSSRQGAFKLQNFKRFGQNAFQWFTELLVNILCFFKPDVIHFCKVAKNWLKEKFSTWQRLPWYIHLWKFLDRVAFRKRSPILHGPER